MKSSRIFRAAASLNRLVSSVTPANNAARSLLLLSTLLPLPVMSAPVVTGVTGGIHAGSSITISGSGFGTGGSMQEWLGDNIASGAVGSNFVKSGWSNAGYGWAPARYASDVVRGKSLRVTLIPWNVWNGEFTYHLPAPIGPGEKIYLTWWVKYNGSTSGQWKMLRLSGTDTLVDGTQELAFFNHFTAGPQVVVDPGTRTDHTLWPGSFDYFPLGDNKWYRMEVYVETSSAGSNNGSVRVTRYDGSSVNTYTATSLMTHANAGYRYNHVIFQNYRGDGNALIPGSISIAFDDIYIQDSQARVELCDSSTWSNRGHCEIQVKNAWADRSITARTNLGTLANTAALYLYVIDAKGGVNANGYALTSIASNAAAAVGVPDYVYSCTLVPNPAKRVH